MNLDFDYAIPGKHILEKIDYKISTKLDLKKITLQINKYKRY